MRRTEQVLAIENVLDGHHEQIAVGDGHRLVKGVHDLREPKKGWAERGHVVGAGTSRMHALRALRPLGATACARGEGCRKMERDGEKMAAS